MDMMLYINVPLLEGTGYCDVSRSPAVNHRQAKSSTTC